MFEILKDKQILLGVCGGIAIYKVCEVVRLLTKAGACVKVIMTNSAQKFISPMVFSTLSGQRTYTEEDFFKVEEGKIFHIELAKSGEVVLILPATASFISKLASGQASELLLATLLATKAPVYLFPSMNVSMWENPLVQENLKKLKSFGYLIYEPSEGDLACGEVGKGRLPEPSEIVEVVKAHFKEKSLKGKKVLITGGPTKEPLDEVRFITNASSGKMAYFLSKEGYYRGAEVHLIWSISETLENFPKLNYFSEIPFPKIYKVSTTKEMLEVCLKIFPECDIAIFSAAPCDFRPKIPYPGKLKKTEKLIIEFEVTEDISKTLSQIKKPHQITVGFALDEPSKLENYALSKKEEKKFDFIVANPLSTPGKDFSDFIIYKPTKEREEFKNFSKEFLASHLLDLITLEIFRRGASC
ncbi:MAG: bifunctional phosphopantothenoylcysteine decarboxylase/phosphopantothenate--cysteine ligase CoaBC [Thermodesulfobacteriaceae bacterium]|nr:bifunctional phosphopantothenoylcysteine decarboxylase/phosphopantothenate--cysteine ligase CoaBC [Thermodesulfobacteriaceae bacterium]